MKNSKVLEKLLKMEYPKKAFTISEKDNQEFIKREAILNYFIDHKKMGITSFDIGELILMFKEKNF